MSGDEVDVNYVIPGTEDVTYFTFEDSSGDERTDANHARMPGWQAVIIFFGIGLALAVLLFYSLIRYERLKNERKEAIKLKFSGKGKDNDVSSTAGSIPENSQEKIEEGVIVHIWMEEKQDEQKTDEESQITSNSGGSNGHNNSCLICRIAFETGVEVCSSRNPKCGHFFHQACMFNWLQYQKGCPVCNEEYLVK